MTSGGLNDLFSGDDDLERLTGINRKQILKNLSYEDETADKITLEKISDCEILVMKNIHPRYMGKCFNLRSENDRVYLVDNQTKGNELKLSGEKILSELYYCEKAVLFCITLSGDIDMEIGLIEKQDIEKAIMLDAVASAALEDYCDIVEKDVSAKYPDYQITYRFSPAYGDMPVNTNSDFVAMLDAERRIGVSVSESGKFTPRYSIAAILGLKKK